LGGLWGGKGPWERRTSLQDSAKDKERGLAHYGRLGGNQKLCSFGRVGWWAQKFNLKERGAWGWGDRQEESAIEKSGDKGLERRTPPIKGEKESKKKENKLHKRKGSGGTRRVKSGKKTFQSTKVEQSFCKGRLKGDFTSLEGAKTGAGMGGEK